MTSEEPQWVDIATSNILERGEALSGLEVLTGVIDLETDRENSELPIKPLGAQLISDLQLVDTRGLVIFGPPGVGKTTLRQQMSVALIRLGFESVIISHDEIVDALETGQVRNGREFPCLGESQDWGEEERAVSNAELHREITEALKDENNRIIVEAVAAGKIDRGIGALQRIFNEHPDEFVTLGLVADPRVLLKAKQIRALIRDSGIEDDQVPDLLRKEGVIVTSDIPMSRAEMGRVVASRVQMEATPREIDLIAGEFDEAALAVINKLNDADAENEVLIPTTTQTIVKIDQQKDPLSYSRNVAKLLRHYTVNVYGINARGYIALNPFQSGEIHLYI